VGTEDSGVLVVRPTGDRDFIATTDDARLTFDVDQAGRTTGLVLYSDGSAEKAVRVARAPVDASVASGSHHRVTMPLPSRRCTARLTGTLLTRSIRPLGHVTSIESTTRAVPKPKCSCRSLCEI
jgi:hypothetical protein